jgi:hypothetical protein
MEAKFQEKFQTFFDSMEAKFQERFQTFFDSHTIFRSDVVSAINASDQRMSQIKSTLLIVPSTQEAKKNETGKVKNLAGAPLGKDKTKSVVKKEKRKEKTCFDSD